MGVFVIDTESIVPSLKLQMNEYIGRTLAAGKNVKYFLRDIMDLPESIEKLALEYPELLEITDSFVPIEIDELPSERLTAPVILVGGLLQQADVTEVVFKLGEYFRNSGVNVSVYTNSLLAKIFGFDNLQSVFSDKKLDEASKINEIKRVVLAQEKLKRPEVIIIEAPDAVMKYNQIADNGYGIRTYMVSQAVDFDYFICCMPFEVVELPFLNAVNQELEKRLGCAFSAVHASNIILDSTETRQAQKVSVSYASVYYADMVVERAKAWDISVFNMIRTEAEQLYEALGD